ncbi:FAD-dependent oxidoreductase [Microbacterium sp. 4R-513]|uniref:NAD(P)/FAD-dependent oxidoreductase n=1 Tax=Microbacterium sp. 4R-513 TaxID=2567934 RepID=UPI0013E1C9FE|nr:FAD-dependent oxidoreductase [Microbacterium sp. 4R-513]QIG40019.1 FAD-dependent oxidoreductase [Microbacterium sp. 4R-513]
MTHFVIVGGGLAAGKAVERLRKEGFDGDITVLAAEQHPPYQRPPLSKGYLEGKEGTDAVILHPADWYGEQGVELRTGVAATEIDPADHRVALADGSTLRYDKLLIATGSSPRRLPLDGAELSGVRMLRTLDDSDALAAELRGGGRRLVLIGSGWIGMEVAATAKTLGNDVTVLERGAVPLAAAVGAEMGAVFRDLHLAHGVDLRASVEVEGIMGGQRAEGVRVDGDVVPADLVVIGVGAVPNTALAEEAGIAVQNGIVTDASLLADAPDVYAAGDVASAYHPVIEQHLRSEHWDNALKSGAVAAKSMLGIPATHSTIPYFYTDQFDLGMELSGYAPLMKDAQVVTRGDVAAREFIAFWHDGERVVGAMNVNVWDVQDQLKKLIRDAAPFTADALRDESIDLEQLAAAGAPQA